MAGDRELVLDVLREARLEICASARIFLAAARTDAEGKIELPRDRNTLRLIHRRLARIDRAIVIVRAQA